MRRQADIKVIRGTNYSAYYLDNHFVQDQESDNFEGVLKIVMDEVEIVKSKDEIEFIISNYIIDDNWLKHQKGGFPDYFNQIPKKWIKKIDNIK